MSKTSMAEEHILQEYEIYVRDLILASVHGKLLGISEYHLGWRNEEFQENANIKRGKRARPMVCMLTFLIFSDDYQGVFPAAAAIEFIHSASLIFDDIQDKDEMRRGKPAVWSLWGEDEAINVGVLLQALAFKALSQTRGLNDKPGTAAGIFEYISGIMLRMSEGQQKDIEMAKQSHLPEPQEYISMICGKTGALFEASACLGALAAGAAKDDLELCRTFGLHLGMAFQIFDDIAGIWGMKVGGLDKPASDLENRKKSFPLLIVFPKCGTVEDQELAAKYLSGSQMGNDDYAALKELLNHHYSKEKTISLGMAYLNESINALRKITGRKQVKSKIEEWIKEMAAKQLEAAGSYRSKCTGTWNVNKKNKMTGKLKA